MKRTNQRQRAGMVIATAIAAVFVLFPGITTRGAIGPLPTPTPSFDTSATVTVGPPLPIPAGEIGVTGTSYLYMGPDGTVYHVYQQITRIDPNATPAPTPTPAPSPTPTSTPAPSPVTTVIDDEFMTFFGTWTAYPKTTSFAKFNIGDHASSTIGSAVGFIFTGSEVRLFGAVAPQNGIASVRVDGGTAIDADLYGPIRIDQAPLFYSGPLAPGIHRIVMTVTGRKNAAATGTVVPIDRADILDGTIVPPLTP